MGIVVKEGNIHDLYYDEGKGNKKRFTSLLVSLAKKEIADGSPNKDQLIKALGGAYSCSKELFKFRSDKVLGYNMVCQRCSKAQTVKTATPNKNGYICNVTENSKNITYLVRTNCAVCDSIKTHFVSKNDLEPDAISYIDKELSKNH